MDYHKSVLLKKSVDFLEVEEGGEYVDVTFGGGGHSKEILSRVNSCSLFSFDQDEDALKNELKDDRLILIHANFSDLKSNLKLYQASQVDGLLADLGVSSHQFDDESRGFSIRANERLDMRMSKKNKRDAQVILNTYAKEDLLRVFKEHSDLKSPGRVVGAILKKVEEGKMETTEDLIQSVRFISERNKENKFLAQVFQAVRMEVNDELGALKSLLIQSAEVLKPGGKLVVIAYHSIEDRLVKNFMKTGTFDGNPEKDVFGRFEVPFKMTTKKPIIPEELELSENNRSRSAKLRVAVKL